jgi:hypothetical protein
VAEHLGIFNEVMASNEQTTFPEPKKHRLLVERFGDDGGLITPATPARTTNLSTPGGSILVVRSQALSEPRRFGNVESELSSSDSSWTHSYGYASSMGQEPACVLCRSQPRMIKPIARAGYPCVCRLWPLCL